MKISCECGGDEFTTDVPCRIEVFVNTAGKITVGMTGEIMFMPKTVHLGQIFTCTACGERANVDNPIESGTIGT